MSKSNYYIAILFLIGVSAWGCDDDQCIAQNDCIESVLKEHDMVPYTEKELGCKFFLSLFEFRGKQYFQLGSHCADMVAYPFDCDGNELCVNEQSVLCTEFGQRARYIGIVGMAPH
jgi:hypothetical protein